MKLNDFQEKFNPILYSFVKDKSAEIKSIAKEDSVDLGMDYLDKLIKSGGKKIRPYVCYITYKMCGGGKNIKQISDILNAIELFHIFCLIHDDVMDKGQSRYGTDTINEFFYKKYLKNKGERDYKHIANSQAILIGDIIFSWVNEILIKPEITKDTKNIFRKMISEVFVGQIIDIDLMSKDKIKTKTLAKKNNLKTAVYTFVNPMLIGFSMSGSKNQLIKKWIFVFGENIGEAYQIKDDLNDVLNTKSKSFGKTPFSDIQDGEHTLLTQYVFEKESANEIKKLKTHFGKVFKNKKIEEEIKNIFINSGAVEYSKNKIREKVNIVKNETAKIKIDKKYKDIWFGIINLFEI